jgi:phage terminase large subunit-like protein
MYHDYALSVKGGHIVAGKYVRLAVDRYLDDLEKQRDDDFPYTFDEQKATAACAAIPALFRHSIGEHAGQPFVLEPWQQFAVANIFGWKRKDGRGRRFRRIYWSMGRKNGKSTIAAAIAILIAGFDINPTTGEPEARSQVILAATKREQAEKVIMAEILRMRHQSPIIRGGSHVANKLMTFEHNGGNIQAVGSDRPYDGLNPSLVVMDETHAWTNQHRRFYDTMKTGSGSRVQPLTMTVTTAGDDQSHLWIEEVGFAKAVLDKTVNDEGDDPFDEECWIKANPNLGISISKEFLRSQIEPAKTSPQALNRFKRYHANILVSSTERIFSLEDYDKCKGELSDWREAEAVGAGIDLGGRDDLASAAFVARFPTAQRDSETGRQIYRYELRVKSYISANTPRDLSAVPFCNWIDAGLINVTQTPMADLQEDFIEDYWNFYCSDCAIDPYQAQQFGEQVSQQGIVIATMPQTQSQFNEPISEFRQAMADTRIRHDGNPLLRWCLSNAVAVRDRSDRWMLDKANSSQKIDPLVSTIMAFRRAMVAIGRGGGHFIT